MIPRPLLLIWKSAYDLLVDTAPSQSDGYYNTNKAAIDAIDEISLVDEVMKLAFAKAGNEVSR